METLYARLTPFGDVVFWTILLMLVLSGFYYWCRRLRDWLAQPKPLHRMNHDELKAFVASIMRPPETALKHAKLHGTIGDLSLILSGSAGAVIASCVVDRHPGLDAGAEERIRDAAQGIAETIHLGTLARSLGSAERDYIITELQRIADTISQTDDAKSLLLLVELIRTADELERFEMEIDTTR